MADTAQLPFFSKLIPSGLVYGNSYMVQYQPHSLWYETSLTLAAQTLKAGIGTEYHTFQHPPSEVRAALSQLGLDCAKLEEDHRLRIVDSYKVALGLEPTPKPSNPNIRYHAEYSLDSKDYLATTLEDLRDVVARTPKKLIHIDDNTSVILNYNEEKPYLDAWRTRSIPETKALEHATIHAFVTGIHSDNFYRQFESISDGIIDMQSSEEEGEMRHYMRVRIIRGKPHDSRWYQLKLLNNGEVTLEGKPASGKELGIGGWIRGSKSGR